jgi:predicted nucleotidyltransferase
MFFVILSSMTDEKLSSVLLELRHEFARILGDTLEQMLLFGSRARGDARPDSDVDILVILKQEFDYSEMLQNTIDVVAQMSLDNDLVISRIFMTKEKFEQDYTPFLLNIRREAVAI